MIGLNFHYGPWPVCPADSGLSSSLEAAFSIMHKYADDGVQLAKHFSSETCKDIHTLANGVLNRFFSESPTSDLFKSETKYVCHLDDGEQVPALSHQAVKFVYNAFEKCVDKGTELGRVFQKSYENFQASTQFEHEQQMFDSATRSNGSIPQTWSLLNSIDTIHQTNLATYVHSDTFPRLQVPHTPTTLVKHAKRWYADVCHLNLGSKETSLVEFAKKKGHTAVKETCERFTIAFGQFAQTNGNTFDVRGHVITDRKTWSRSRDIHNLLPKDTLNCLSNIDTCLTVTPGSWNVNRLWTQAQTYFTDLKSDPSRAIQRGIRDFHTFTSNNSTAQNVALAVGVGAAVFVTGYIGYRLLSCCCSSKPKVQNPTSDSKSTEPEGDGNKKPPQLGRVQQRVIEWEKRQANIL